LDFSLVQPDSPRIEGAGKKFPRSEFFSASQEKRRTRIEIRTAVRMDILVHPHGERAKGRDCGLRRFGALLKTSALHWHEHVESGPAQA
jgi:hypothetical protein